MNLFQSPFFGKKYHIDSSYSINKQSLSTSKLSKSHTKCQTMIDKFDQEDHRITDLSIGMEAKPLQGGKKLMMKQRIISKQLTRVNDLLNQPTLPTEPESIRKPSNGVCSSNKSYMLNQHLSYLERSDKLNNNLWSVQTLEEKVQHQHKHHEQAELKVKFIKDTHRGGDKLKFTNQAAKNYRLQHIFSYLNELQVEQAKYSNIEVQPIVKPKTQRLRLSKRSLEQSSSMVLFSEDLDQVCQLVDNLLSTVKEISASWRGMKQIQKLNGFNELINGLLFTKDEHGELCLKSQSLDEVQSWFINMAMSELEQKHLMKVGQIQKTELFKKLSYFNYSLNQLQKRILFENLEQKIMQRKILQEGIGKSLGKLVNIQKSDIQKCIPIKNLYSISSSNQLSKTLERITTLYKPLNKIRSTDILRCEIMDKQSANQQEM